MLTDTVPATSKVPSKGETCARPEEDLTTVVNTMPCIEGGADATKQSQFATNSDSGSAFKVAKLTPAPLRFVRRRLFELLNAGLEEVDVEAGAFVFADFYVQGVGELEAQGA
jgi:hypothetical protein